MKNLFNVFMFVLVASAPMHTNAQVNLGINAGLNAANLKTDFKDEANAPSTKMRALFHVGFAAELGFSDLISLQTGLIYSAKGFNFDLEDGLEEGMTVDGYQKAILNYLEVPIHVAFKFGGFQIYTGPYVAMGIGGKSKYDYTYMDNGDEVFSMEGEYKLKSVFGDISKDDLAEDEGAFKALDIGLEAGIGYRIGPVLINAGYSLGLSNLTPGDKDDANYDPKDEKMSNRVITVSATYYFGQ